MGGWPARRISPDETAYIVKTAVTRPEKLGMPFTRRSIRKLADYLAANPVRMVEIGRERLRQILRRNKVSFQRTRTWKESTAPDREAKLDRIEEVTTQFPNRCFAFDQFGPPIRPHHGGAGRNGASQYGCRPPTSARTESATSMAASVSAAINSGA